MIMPIIFSFLPFLQRRLKQSPSQRHSQQHPQPQTQSHRQLRRLGFASLPVTFPAMLVALMTATLMTATFMYSPAASAASWNVSDQDGTPVAITPKHNMILKMIKPKDGIWGKLYVSLSDEQVENLRKYRLDKYFAFISVGVEVDGYTRDTNAKVEETQKFVRIDIDQRMWEGIKKGNKFNVYLPDGSTYKETLRGSSKALRRLEQHTFKDY